MSRDTQTIFNKIFYLKNYIENFHISPLNNLSHKSIDISVCRWWSIQIQHMPMMMMIRFSIFLLRTVSAFTILFYFFSEQKFYHCKWTLNVIKINRKIALHPNTLYFILYTCMSIYWSVGWALSIKKICVCLIEGVREDIINVIIERWKGRRKENIFVSIFRFKILFFKSILIRSKCLK